MPADGRDGLFLALNDAYDVMIVDRMLPGLDGLGIVTRGARGGHQARRPCFSAPWAASTTGSSGLDAGGDDYLVKPFAFAELLARRQCARRAGRR